MPTVPSKTHFSPLAVVSFVASALAFTAHAHADPVPGSVQLDWIAPPECPARTWLVSEISRLLGHSLDERTPAAMRVRGETLQIPDGSYRVVVQTDGPDGVGERVLEDPACTHLAEAVAVVVALAIDPSAVAETERRQHEPPAVPPPSLPPPRVPPERMFHFAGALMGLADVGTLPQLSAGLGLSFSLLVGRHVRAELWGSTWFPQDVSPGNGVPGGAHLQPFVLAGVRGCVSPGWSRIELGGCLGVEGGVIAATGFDISDPATANGPWSAASLGGLFVVKLVPWFGLRLGVEAAFAFLRPNFTVRAFRGGDLTTLDVYQPSAIVGRAVLGVEFQY